SERAPEQNSSTVNSPLPKVLEPSPSYAKPLVYRLWELAAWLWLAGVAFFVIRTGIAEYLFRKRLKRSIRVLDPHLLAVLDDCIQLASVNKNIILMETDALKSPALFGVFRTRMLLPTGLASTLTSQQLAHIFLHELAHYKRHDIAANWIAGVLRVVHWFNPLIWYGLNRWQDDQELSCDALAVRYLKPEVVQDYGRTLIRVLEFAGPEPRQLLSTVGISGGKSLSKRRIIMITLFKKPSFKWTLVGAAAIIAVAVVAMTLPKVNDPAAKLGRSPSKTQGSLNQPAGDKETGSKVQTPVPQKPAGQSAQDSIVYKNSQYGFSFSLPKSWKGYSIITDKWEGLPIGGDQAVETGPIISIRHPLWTSENKRQDIPIMIFTRGQWNSLKEEKFHIGAAPIGPSELGRNNGYVFALPARYNYAFPTGYEEVDKILNNKPLQTHDITLPKQTESVVAALQDYFPLKKGNKWVYQGTGNEYASFSREVLFTEGNLAQTLEINGGADVTKILQITGNTVTEIFKQVEPSAPVNLLHKKPNEQRILLNSPLSIGTKWNDGNTQIEIVDTAATVKTPAGTFKSCIKVKSTFPTDSSVMYQYYAKGVGLVQEDFITGGDKISSSLESYHLVK
ncbi:MAG TPA: M56 family metallopeptidase, partial [Desulfobacteria bacterium]|nr:M56 family metallopeptidase [Desulfobacteria bacterium]